MFFAVFFFLKRLFFAFLFFFGRFLFDLGRFLQGLGQFLPDLVFVLTAVCFLSYGVWELCLFLLKNKGDPQQTNQFSNEFFQASVGEN